MSRRSPLCLLACEILLLASTVHAATWQYCVPFDTGRAGKDGVPQPGKVLLWMPPQARTLRGLLVGGQLGIELELALDPQVRRACADNDLGIVYFTPHLSGTFHFWQEGNSDGPRLLRSLDDLAKRTGHSEIARIPWITMGHSTAGIFCRNVAYWKSNRVAGIIHIKSGNFHQKDHLPPTGSLAGVPLLAINGQFEVFGPEGGIRKELGRETQWVFVRKDIQQLRQQDENHLMSLLLDLGGDHFHGSPELSAYAAMFIRKAAQYRIPATLPPGDSEIACIPLRADSGWLTDPDLYHPQHAPAAYRDYTGNKAEAFWHYDREMAMASMDWRRNLGNHQALSSPAATWLDDGDGWTFKVKAEFLDTMPESYGGNVGGKPIGHAASPIIYRAKSNEPVMQIAADTFRVLKPVKAVNIAAVNTGDEQHRPTNRWSGINLPQVKGQAQSIDFPAIADVKANAGPVPLRAKATSGPPIYYEVDFGPVVVRDGKIVVSELPLEARFPIECRITAYQVGRRVGPTIAPAASVSQVFRIVQP